MTVVIFLFIYFFLIFECHFECQRSTLLLRWLTTYNFNAVTKKKKNATKLTHSCSIKFSIYLFLDNVNEYSLGFRLNQTDLTGAPCMNGSVSRGAVSCAWCHQSTALFIRS